MNPAHIHCFDCHGILLFLYLIACAMVWMSPLFMVLPLLILAVLALLLPIGGDATGYLSVVRSVCKNE